MCIFTTKHKHGNAFRRVRATVLLHTIVELSKTNRDARYVLFLRNNKHKHEKLLRIRFKDKNGTISKDEFITGAKLDDSVIRTLSLYPVLEAEL